VGSPDRCRCRLHLRGRLPRSASRACRVVLGFCYQGCLMSSAKDAKPKGVGEQDPLCRLGLQLSVLPVVAMAVDRAIGRSRSRRGP
jgi:hypothetical protein